MSGRTVVWRIEAASVGVPADLRAFDALGVHERSVLADACGHGLDAQLAALANDGPPAAIQVGALGSVANIDVLVRWIDRLRQANPALAVVVAPVLRSAQEQALGRACLEQLVSRATLVTLSGADAAALTSMPRRDGTLYVEQAACRLRECGATAVAVTGAAADEAMVADYVDAPWASGWLRSPRGRASGCGASGISAWAAAAALALGFVEIEAVVLGKMAATQAMHGGDGGGDAFAFRIDNLPELVARPDERRTPFPALRVPALGLYAIVESAEWIERVLDAGVRTVQLRIKDASHPRLREEVRRAVAASERAGAQLFINDHWRLAIEERAYGVHLGQEDLGEADLDAIARAGLRLGVSTHAYWEVCRAWALRPSYIACGPIHATATKAMPWIPQGNGNLAYWCRLLPVPVVAIAGMDLTRARQAWDCGASGVAVMSGITAAAQPASAIQAFLDVLGTGRHPSNDLRVARPTLERVAGTRPLMGSERAA